MTQFWHFFGCWLAGTCNSADNSKNLSNVWIKSSEEYFTEMCFNHGSNLLCAAFKSDFQHMSKSDFSELMEPSWFCFNYSAILINWCKFNQLLWNEQWGEICWLSITLGKSSGEEYLLKYCLLSRTVRSGADVSTRQYTQIISFRHYADVSDVLGFEQTFQSSPCHYE